MGGYSRRSDRAGETLGRPDRNRAGNVLPWGVAGSRLLHSILVPAHSACQDPCYSKA